MLKTPPLQTATATIDTLCGRLQSATLLEDRRAAILGLRSFAKQYPASVASGSLRELISILRRDGLGEAGSTKDGRDGSARKSEDGGGDVDTIRLVLETLLMLFNPDSSSPEASEEIAYFMADEFSMRQDNVILLLSLLDPTSPYADYYSRLYSLQLLSAICAARPDRLQECILGAPLGVSRLVGALDDSRDAVRNAGLLLLVDLTSGANEDLRKIIAFEDVFGKTFGLIRAEGGLSDAGVVAQDCLSLLANLVKGSASNQTMFRESGCVPHMTRLLEQAFPPPEPESGLARQAREKAAWGLLQLLGLFLEPGEKSSPQNQAAFFRTGTAQVLIDLGFEEDVPGPLRTLALRDAAALISGNAPLQQAFASMQVETPGDKAASVNSQAPHTNGTRSDPASARASARPSVERQRSFIIEALLDLSLKQSNADSSLRTASCKLILAYLTNHDRIKVHFLQRAIAGHAEHETAANALITLLSGSDDPLSTAYASWIICDLVADMPDTKAVLSALKEGNESEGEDVLTFVQAIGSQLAASLQIGNEIRVAAHAGLLIVLLWDFAYGVDNLLEEGSSLLQALVTAVNPNAGEPVIAGLAAALLGTIYEFSTKDSPIPRRALAPLLTEKLGRSKYLDALLQLRREPAIRDVDVYDEEDHILLGRSFIDLFLLEYARLRKAIDKDPGVEVLPASAIEAGVDRDVLDDLRQQMQTAKDALAQAQQEATASIQQREQERMSATKDLQTANAEIDRLRRINQAMQQGHESELDKLEREHGQQRTRLQVEHQRAMESLKQEAAKQAEARLREQDAAAAQRAQEYDRRIAELTNNHRVEQSKHADTARQLKAITARHVELGSREQGLRNELAELTQRYDKLTGEHQKSQADVVQLQTQLAEATAELERSREQMALLTVQLNDLREELKSKEQELMTERAGFEALSVELDGVKAALTITGSSADVTALREQLKEAQEAEKSAKEELESMLLVMGDIEAKRDEYRAKVKELGGEVTEDEDEDEDEEADGDDGEGEEGDQDSVD